MPHPGPAAPAEAPARDLLDVALGGEAISMFQWPVERRLTCAPIKRLLSPQPGSCFASRLSGLIRRLQRSTGPRRGTDLFPHTETCLRGFCRRCLDLWASSAVGRIVKKLAVLGDERHVWKPETSRVRTISGLNLDSKIPQEPHENPRSSSVSQLI